MLLHILYTETTINFIKFVISNFFDFVQKLRAAVESFRGRIEQVIASKRWHIEK